MPRFRKKPITVHAFQWNGENFDEIKEFAGDSVSKDGGGETLTCATLKGPLTVQKNDWIVRGIMGEFYPVKPHIFTTIYDLYD